MRMAYARLVRRYKAQEVKSQVVDGASPLLSEYREHEPADCDEGDRDGVQEADLLVEEEDGEKDGEDDAELVDGGDLRDAPRL